MDVATTRVEVGVRELKNNLSKFLERVRAGEEVVVTDHGKPVARLTALDPKRSKLQEMIDAGRVHPPKSATRHYPKARIKVEGGIADYVAEQRRR